MQNPVIGFIGAGKVGSVLARALHQTGYQIGGIYNRDPAKSLSLAQYVQAQMYDDPALVVDSCDLIFLTVADDAIESVVGLIQSADWVGKGVVHTSGVHNRHALRVLEDQGAMTGSIHPAFPFAEIDSSVTKISHGVTFAVESDSELLSSWLTDLVGSLNGNIVRLTAEDKVIYHAALVIACNYAVTLYAIAEKLLTGIGIENQSISNILHPLLLQTVQNIRENGIPDALTGPLVREDTITISKHLESLAGDENIRELYRELARMTYPLLEDRGIPTRQIENTIRQDEHHASDYS